jgi:hypothetical protein
MKENRPDELATLQNRAQWALEHPDLLEPSAQLQDMHERLRLWHDPAFGNPTTWAVFESREGASSSRSRHPSPQLVVREVTWDRRHDLGRFVDPLQGVREGFHAPPTILVQDGAIARELIDAWLQEIRQVSIPVLGVTPARGLDGESWGIEIDQPFLLVRLRWWEDGPTEWAPFTQSVVHLQQLLAGASQVNE